jgi:hypothetical protein
MTAIDHSQIRRNECIHYATSIRMETAIASLCQIIGYRQAVAERILRSRHNGDDEYLKNLNELLDHANEKIKAILAIP